MKRLILVVLSLFLVVMTTACGREKAGILFNQHKITVDNAFDNTAVFAPNQRIYYLVFIPKKIATKRIEIQIIKKDNKEERLGYKLYWSRTASMTADQIYYYTDYVVLSEPGAYVMQVYSKDNPTKRLCMAPLWVRN